MEEKNISETCNEVIEGEVVKEDNNKNKFGESHRPIKGKGNFALEHYGLVKEFMDLRSQGVPVTQIHKTFVDKGYELSYNSILNYEKRHRSVMKKVIDNNFKLKTRSAVQVLDVVDKVSSLSTKLERFLEKQLDETDGRLVPQTANAITKQLKLLADMTGTMKSNIVQNQTNVQFNFNDTAMQVNDLIKKYISKKILFCRKCKSTHIGFKRSDAEYEIEKGELKNVNGNAD